MTEESTLSYKRRRHYPDGEGFYFEEDVKEFIHKLKQELVVKYIPFKDVQLAFCRQIDKLAGEKLI